MALEPYVDMDDYDFNTFLEATVGIIEPYLNWSEEDFERFFAKAGISRNQVKRHVKLMKRVSEAIKNEVRDFPEEEYTMISLEELARLKGE